MENKGYKIIELNTLVVGTGTAGYNAALNLHRSGVEDIAIATEGVELGTGRNTGSDKQTYYKLGLGGDASDSVAAMARDLFAGGSVDGDNALCEAALSARCFLNLCELGVPFPTNRYGEYVGYKTDHDPYARATSVGPLTSKQMTERLQTEVERRGIVTYDRCLIVSVILKDGAAVGALGVDTSDGEGRLFVFNCKNIIFATGGPGGLYRDSVYPACHTGSSGVIFEAGVKGQNLTLWQYGLASVAPRWNVSGSYMQVLPRFVSIDEDGKEYDFLDEYFEDEGEALSMVFLKGYQWPFDSKKVLDGSSVIDLLVYRERVLRGRRVYLDFTRNPSLKENVDYSLLASEAYEYMRNAEICFGTPIERLAHMNQPAIDLYMSKGVDLSREMLEISLCAQHNNGGAAVDLWWQTNVNGLFVVGEAAGTHGISRPGGSALNAGQVGSLRAAQYISEKSSGAPMDRNDFLEAAEPYIGRTLSEIERIKKGDGLSFDSKEMIVGARARMSELGGALRELDRIERAIGEVDADLEALPETGKDGDITAFFKLRDLLICQKMYLYAMKGHIERFGVTCGSALYYDKDGSLREGLEELFRFTPYSGEIENTIRKTIQEVTYGGECVCSYREVRPLPEGGGFFENVWRSYRENKNVY